MIAEKMTITALRVRAGYSQKEIARILSVPRSTLVKWESDSSDIPISKLLKLTNIYRYPLDGIYFGNTDKLNADIRRDNS